MAGGFSNYRYVTNAVKHLAYNITDSIVATIGNNVQLRTEEENYEVLRKYTFCRYVLGNIAATGLCICTDSFVSIVFGEQYLLNNAVLYLIVADIFIGIVYGPLGEYITVLGYFRYEKYINLIGALINIGLSIGLVQFMGVEGVLIGTVVSQVFFWIAKSVLLCRKYFESKEKLRQLWKDYLGYTALLIIQVLILHLAKNALWSSSHGIITFIGEGIASVSVSLIMVTIFFGRSEYYQYLMNIGKKMISKFIRK